MYRIGGVEMKLPLIVGAGACKTPASILPYNRADVSVGAVSMGSTTPNKLYIRSVLVGERPAIPRGPIVGERTASELPHTTSAKGGLNHENRGWR